MNEYVTKKEYDELVQLVLTIGENLRKLSEVHEIGQQKTIEKFQEHDEMLKAALETSAGLFEMIKKYR